MFGHIRLLVTNHFLCTMYSILRGLNSSARCISCSMLLYFSLALHYKIHSLTRSFFVSEIHSVARSLALYICTRVPVSQLSEALSELTLYFHDTPSLSRNCARPGNEPAVLSRRKKIGFPRISREEFFNTRT